VVVPCTTKVALGVVEFIPKLPPGVTVKIVAPVEELIWKGLREPVPWMSKETVEDVALIPVTVPLSIIMEAPVVEGPVALIK
jgi:hypothetical protein